MQLQIPEHLLNIYQFKEKFFYIEKFGETLTIADNLLNEIEITKCHINDIIEHNNKFLSENNQITSIKGDDILYK